MRKGKTRRDYWIFFILLLFFIFLNDVLTADKCIKYIISHFRPKVHVYGIIFRIKQHSVIEFSKFFILVSKFDLKYYGVVI